MSISLAPQLEPDEGDRTFGELLRAAREAAGISQRAAALAFGVDRSAIRQWETDRTLVAPARMPLIEDALHLEPGTLGAWVRHSPLYLATLRPAPDTGAIPGLLTLVPPLPAAA